MKRVLKKGKDGGLDMEAAEEPLRELMIRLKICVILLIPESSQEEFEEMFRKILHCNAKKLLWCR